MSVVAKNPGSASDCIPFVATDPRRVEKIRELLRELERSEVDYCHWKSNHRLLGALQGVGDLDLLIASHDAGHFQETVARLGFRLMALASWEENPSVKHYFGLDEASGKIVHLHAYFRVVSGGGFDKKYRLPVQNMLLSNCRYLHGIRVPSEAADLVVFVLRKVLEHASWAEYPVLRAQAEDIQLELDWLIADDTVTEACELVERWLPFVGADLFRQCLDTLRKHDRRNSLAHLGRRLRSLFRGFAINSPVRRRIAEVYRTGVALSRRLLGASKTATPATGGLVIAFVGPEAVGKSTLLSAAKDWLGEYFRVEVACAGKPPSTWISLVPNSVKPFMQWYAPHLRTSTIEVELSEAGEPPSADPRTSLLYVSRSALIAYDQWRLLTRCYRKATKGAIVLCDRYPSAVFGGMDGPRVDARWFTGKFSLKRQFARIEEWLYASMPKPDLVIRLTVPLAVALQRNATRVKKSGMEPERFIRTRHSLIDKWGIQDVDIVVQDTDQPLEQTKLEMKNTIWRIL